MIRAPRLARARKKVEYQSFTSEHDLDSMHRFYLPPAECRGSSLRLSDREAHHALHVLRLRRGDQLLVLDGEGLQLQCEVSHLTRDAIDLTVRRRESIAPVPYQLTLVQALPKRKLMDAIVQKATELGVFRIVPLLSERVVTHLDSKQQEDKTEHWRALAVEAIKQCGSPWLPRIEGPVTPEAFLARKETFELSLIASLQPNSRHPRELFECFAAQYGRRPQSICVWVGPEGDFTASEIAAAKSAGAVPVSLGKLVLRCETAAIYCLSVLNYELETMARPQINTGLSAWRKESDASG